MDAEHLCHFNKDVLCDNHTCMSCGWNPVVEKARIKAMMAPERLYRIPFTGYCEVWAKSAEEAAEKAEDIKQQWYADYDYGKPVCLDKEDDDEDELD